MRDNHHQTGADIMATRSLELTELQLIISRIRPELTGRQVGELARELLAEGYRVTGPAYGRTVTAS